MPNNPLTYSIRNALKGVKAPEDDHDMVATGRLIDASVSPAGVAKVTLDMKRLPPAGAASLKNRAAAAVAMVDGVVRVVVVDRDQQAAPSSPTTPTNTPDAPTGDTAPGSHANPLGLAKRPPAPGDMLPDVGAVIAVASGKGGVGKSTVAANLAMAFVRAGRQVGFLDADIYGPSAPVLFGLAGQRPTVVDGKIQPIDAHGLKIMSIGFLVDEEKALAWRGPMVMGALRQLINDVEWGALDLLIIDTPPGTGDVHLSLAQTKKLSGAIIVSTPQTMALADVRRGVEFFRKAKTPILGLLQNMAYLDIGDGVKRPIFGEDGAKAAAAALDVPFLGDLPISLPLRESADAGAPIAAGDIPTAFDALAQKIESAQHSLRAPLTPEHDG